MRLLPENLVAVENCLYLVIAYILVFLVYPKSKIKWFYPFAILLTIEVCVILYVYYVEGGGMFLKGLSNVHLPFLIACFQWPIALILAIFFRIKESISVNKARKRRA